MVERKFKTSFGWVSFDSEKMKEDMELEEIKELIRKSKVPEKIKKMSKQEFLDWINS